MTEARCLYQVKKESEPFLYCGLFDYPVICGCVGYEEKCSSFRPRIEEIIIPEEALEAIKWNALHDKCSQCRRIYCKLQGDRIDPRELTADDLAHLEWIISCYRDKEVKA